MPFEQPTLQALINGGIWVGSKKTQTYKVKHESFNWERCSSPPLHAEQLDWTSPLIWCRVLAPVTASLFSKSHAHQYFPLRVGGCEGRLCRAQCPIPFSFHSYGGATCASAGTHPVPACSARLKCPPVVPACSARTPCPHVWQLVHV
jgi:hypothetical protein